jgi:hypothetical protein
MQNEFFNSIVDLPERCFSDDEDNNIDKIINETSDSKTPQISGITDSSESNVISKKRELTDILEDTANRIKTKKQKIALKEENNNHIKSESKLP